MNMLFFSWATFGILIFLIPIPIIHLLLHVALSFWRRHPKVFYGVCGLLWVILSPLAWQTANASMMIFTPSPMLIILGATLAVAALIVLVLAIVSLGPKRFFLWAVLHSVLIPQNQLRAGIYKFFAHPAYVAYLAIAIAFLLITGRLILLGLFFYLAILMSIVADLEDCELTERISSEC